MKQLVAIALATLAASAHAQVINEFNVSHTGTDSREFLEIYWTASTDLSMFALLQIEGDGTGAGVVDSVDIPGMTDFNGFWVSNFFENRIENGTITLLLVAGWTGSTGMDLDANNDGVLDSEPWAALVDGIAVHDNGATDWTYGGVPVLFPNFDGGTFTVGGASRIPNGQDTDTTADWVRNDFDLYGIAGYVGTPDLGEAVNTPGTTNRVVVEGVLTVTPDTGFASSGPQGGPFTPATTDYQLGNSGDAAVDWTAASDAGWTDLSLAAGTLIGGQTATVSVVVNASANSLAPGIYPGTLSLTNITNGNGDTTRGLELTVTGSACEPCDTNCDGSVNGQDIGNFIAALGGNPNGCSPCNSDADGNGSVNGQDIDEFIACLGG